MKKAIIGAGGSGREVCCQMLDNNPNEEITFFVDDKYAHDDILPISKFDPLQYEVVVAIGDPKARQRLVESLPPGTKYFTFIHKTAQIIDKNIEVGEGTIICPGCILTTNIKLGKHSQLNLQTTISHDCVIGDYFTTAPGAKIAGNCGFGDRVYIGTNASVKEKISLCSDVVIGLNAGVVKSIAESGVYVGTPSKKVGDNEL